MNKIPQEVLDKIVDELVEPRDGLYGNNPDISYGDLIQYATISPNFQNAVERRTFRHISVKSTDFGRFKVIFQNRRRLALRSINLHVVLPEYETRYKSRLERKWDHILNNKSFSVSFKSIFDILKSWESENQGRINPYGIVLQVEAWSPSDEGSDEIRQGRWQRSSLMIEDLNSLPSIQTITGFTLWMYCRRMIDPSGAAALTEKMPNLQSIKWQLFDNEKWEKFNEERCQRRSCKSQTHFKNQTNISRTLGFARRLTNDLSIANLTTFDLEFLYEEPKNHGWTPHPILQASGQGDALSQALHQISQAPNLRIFRIGEPIIISTEIFWPLRPNPSKTQIENGSHTQVKHGSPFWPSLEEFYIVLSSVLPDGTWMFSGVPGSPSPSLSLEDRGRASPPPWFGERFDGDIDDHEVSGNDSDDSNIPDKIPALREPLETGATPCWQFRRLMRDDVYESWARSMALATECMPKLKTGLLSMRSGLGGDVGEHWDCYIHTICQTLDNGGKEWDIQIGQGIIFDLNMNLQRFLQEKAGSLGRVSSC
jgi:hypothetical protein